MASPLTLRSTTRSSVLRDSDGDDLRGVPEVEEEIVTEGLFKTGVIPLVVRLSTGRADRVITRDVRTLGFRSTIPGGFASCEVQLDRPLSIDPDEIQLYGDLYIYDGRHGGIIWQGRMEDPGKSEGSQGEVWTVRAVGPAAHARDRNVKLIYIDRSFERWFRYPAASKGGMADEREDGAGEINLQFQAPMGLGVAAGWQESKWYLDVDDAGQKMARLECSIIGGKNDANWKTQAAAGPAPWITLWNDNLSLVRAAKSGVVVVDFPNGKSIFYVNLFRVGGALVVADNDTWCQRRNLVVTTVRLEADGTEILAGYGSTVLASEVVNDLLGRLLDQYDGPNASVEVTAKNIDQLSYPDGVTPEKVMADLMLLETDYYWAAWEGKPAHFEWRSWPMSIRYEADTKDGFMSPASAVEIYNRVSVRWRDPQGQIKITVRTATVDVLDDAGLIREARLNLADEFGSLAIAQEVGDAFLAEHSSAPNAGTLSVSSPIYDADQGREVDPWEIRPGYLIRIRNVLPRVDALNATARDAITVFRIVAVDYNADSNTASLELDSQPRTLAGLLSETERRLDQLRKR